MKRAARLTRAVPIVALVAAAIVPGLAAQGVEDGLEGAWRVDRVVTTGPGADTLANPQPGMLLFTNGYYSYTYITGDGPRPDLPPGGLSMAEDLLSVWSPFTANAGNYEVSGDRMTRYPYVAKSPAAMARGAFNAYTFRLSGDTLWTTTYGTESGRARYPTTVRYIRLR